MKTSEMIAMLEKNPKLKFKGNNSGDIYAIDHLGIFGVNKHDGAGYVRATLHIDDDWQLIRESVPWQEALQAWAEGKTISCKVEGQAEAIYKSSTDFLKDQANFAIIRNELLKGVWYIRDDDADA